MVLCSEVVPFRATSFSKASVLRDLFSGLARSVLLVSGTGIGLAHSLGSTCLSVLFLARTGLAFSDASLRLLSSLSAALRCSSGGAVDVS